MTVMQSTTSKAAMKCGSTGVELTGSYVVVPVGSELKENSKHDLVVPSACFKNAGGESFAANIKDYDFTTINKGATSIYTNDLGEPEHMTKGSLTVTPSNPVDKSWVTASTDFYLYFGGTAGRHRRPPDR
jgi:hypothetical protein